MAVNKVEINGEVKLDLTQDTVTEDTLLKGASAHDAAGNPVEGKVITTPVPKTSNLLKGDGAGGVSAAKAGTDYATPAQVAAKQDKLTGTQGQVVGFDENGNAVAQNAPSGGGMTEEAADGKYLKLAGGDMSGKLTAPKIETGSGNTNYFQSRKFRGEGDANTYYHAIDFGYKNHDQVDFHEWGGIWNFFKNTSGKANGGSLCGKITTNGWEGGAKLTGSPTAPTPGTSDNSTRIATTAFVNSFNSTKLESNGDGSNVTAAFTAASSRTNISTGEKLSVIFGKIAKFFSDLKTVAFTGSYNDLSDKPTIPTAVTVDSAMSDTSTNPVQNKVIKTELGKKAASSHNQAAGTITAGTFAGAVVAGASNQAPETSLLRNSKLVSSDTTPTNNGEIFWTYG